MRADRLRREASPLHRLANQVADRPGREPRTLPHLATPVVRPEERSRIAQPTTRFGEIGQEQAGYLRLDGDLPIAATLAASDRDHETAVRIVVKIPHIEPDCLSSP